MITDKDISTGLDEAYQKAGGNAYFGNGFKAGVEFALKFEEKNNKEIADSQAKVEKCPVCDDCHKRGEVCWGCDSSPPATEF